MKKKTILAIAVSAVIALSGCSSSSSTTAETSDIQSTFSSQEELSRYNAYVDMNNLMLDEIDSAAYTYFYSALYQEEFELYEEDAYWCTYVDESSIEFMDTVYDIANGMETKEDIDNAYIEVYPVMKELCETINQVYDYIESEGYIEDDYAQAAEFHTTIYNDFNDYLDLSNTFIDLVSVMTEEQMADDMAYFESEGYEVLYSMNQVMLTAKEIQVAIYNQDVYDENIIELDITDIQPLYEQYAAEVETCINNLDDDAKVANDGFGTDNPYIDEFEDAVEENLEALEEILERVQSQTPIEDYNEDDGTIWKFDSSLSTMIDSYNYAIEY